MKRFLTLLLLLIAALYLFHAELLSSYANLFRKHTASKGADAIIILGGNTQTRPYYAMQLYREGYGDAIYLTQPRHYNSKVSHIIKYEYEYAQDILGEQNLSAAVIPSNKNGATSTFDEAYDTVRYLKTHAMHHIILVTDAFHTARAHYAYSKIFELMGVKEVTIETAAAPNALFNEKNWWRSEAGLSAYILEPIKFIFYFLRDKNSTLVEEH